MHKDHIAFLSPEDSIEHLASDSTFGLAEREALLRKKEHGSNELPKITLQELFTEFTSPFFPFLIFLSGISFYFTRSIFVFCFLLLFALIHQAALLLLYRKIITRYFEKYQFFENTLPEYIHTVRGNHIKDIPTSFSVPGDIIYVEAGESVGADIRILSTSHLTVDESILFGPMHACSRKSAKELKDRFKNPLSENILLAGSYILEGSAKGIVWHTGKERYLHKLYFSKKQNVWKNRLYSSVALVYWTLLMLVTGLTLAGFLKPYLWTYIGMTLGLLVPFAYPLALLPAQDSLKKSIPNGMLAQIETYLEPGISDTKVFLQGQEVDLSSHSEVKKNKSLLENFFELFFLAVPEEVKKEQLVELRSLEHFVQKTCKMNLDSLPNLEKNATLSRFYFDIHKNECSGKTVYLNTRPEENAGDKDFLFDTDPLITLIFSHPATLLKNATYISDENMQLMKRRFFKGEKEKLEKHIKELDRAGYLLYAVGVEETLMKTKQRHETTATFVGFIMIPWKFKPHGETALNSLQNHSNHLWLFSFRSFSAPFLAETFSIPMKDIMDNEDLMHKSEQFKKQLSQMPFRVFHKMELEDITTLSKILKKHRESPVITPLWEKDLGEFILPETAFATTQKLSRIREQVLISEQKKKQIQHLSLWYAWILALAGAEVLPYIFQTEYLYLLFILPFIPVLLIILFWTKRPA